MEMYSSNQTPHDSPPPHIPVAEALKCMGAESCSNPVDIRLRVQCKSISRPLLMKTKMKGENIKRTPHPTEQH